MNWFNSRWPEKLKKNPEDGDRKNGEFDINTNCKHDPFEAPEGDRSCGMNGSSYRYYKSIQLKGRRNEEKSSPMNQICRSSGQRRQNTIPSNTVRPFEFLDHIVQIFRVFHVKKNTVLLIEI